MADLVTELQHLASGAVTPRRRVAETDPLLLDQVYSCTSPRQQQQSSPLDTANSSSPAAKGATYTQAATQQSGNSFTSGATSLNSLAALAAYRRQIYGLDPSTAASRPVSAAAAPAQASAGSRRSFALKSRPNGMTSPDFGSGHVSGLLPRPSVQDTAAPCTPAQSGMGPLVPPRLFQRSSCPPLCAEPLTAPPDDGPGIVAARQADRELLGWAQQLINRLVYDSLQPAVPGAAGPAAATDCPPAGMGSSCGAAASDSAGSGSSQAAAGSLDGQAACEYALGLAPWYTLQGPGDDTLVFESRFESGNLRRAIQVTQFEYDLVLQPDINTRGHTQWFFFAVSNTRAGQAYRFNIINLLKEDSTYNMGMLPLMHSERSMRSTGVGWVRCGSQVAYGANSIVCRKKQTYFTLTFTLEFPHRQDLVHLAHCYPFTWTDQQNHIHALKQSLPPNTLLQHTSLATSLAGNAVDLLTITAAPDRGKPLAQRQGVVLSARVHPGETNSSFIMKGALQQLLADTEEAAQLREAFVFKVVPMLNPDGVIVGNYRCSLAGLDLNRVYQAPDSRLQPVICAFKEMVRAFTQEREVVLSCDMHGHSRRFGVFMYGCEQKPGKDATPVGPGCPLPGSLGGLPCVPARHQERVFPLMLALNAPDLFSYRSCNFKVQKSKSGTGRVVGFREVGLVNAFTLEASFAGAAVGKHAKQHFNTGHLEEMGAAVVRTLLDYWAPPELNSAPELCSQLDAALLQGVSDGSGGSAGRNGGGTAALAAAAAAAVVDSAFERLLGVGEAGEDGEDVCTDSDDDSSEDEKPASRVGSRQAADGALPAAAADRGPGGVLDRDGAASGSSSTVASLADIGRQLTNLLSSKFAAAVDSSGAGLRAVPAGSSAAAAAGAVRNLVEAIKASEAASSTAAAPATAGTSSSDRVKAAAQVPAAACSSAVPAAGGASSSSKAAPDPTQTVAMAAQQLLQKLAAAKAKVQAGAGPVLSPPTAVLAAPGPSGAAGSSSAPSTLSAASRQPSTSQQAAAASTAAVMAAAAGLLAAAAAGTTATAAEGAAAAAATASALTEEEAALLVLPGLHDLLQQLVLQTTQHKNKVASAAKKKGRRKGRWGNPEVLRAARAMADAGLAAALPELGITTRDVADAAGWWDDADSCSSSNLSTPATPSHPDAPGSLPCIGRRVQTAGSRSGKGAALDVERYAYCLEVHKRVAGGVLGASSTEPEKAWEESAVSASPSAAQPGSGSVGRKVVVFAGSQLDALEAGAAAEAGSQPPSGTQAMRRSKSAYPWLRDQPLQTSSTGFHGPWGQPARDEA